MARVLLVRLLPSLKKKYVMVVVSSLVVRRDSLIKDFAKTDFLYPGRADTQRIPEMSMSRHFKKPGLLKNYSQVPGTRSLISLRPSLYGVGERLLRSSFSFAVFWMLTDCSRRLTDFSASYWIPSRNSFDSSILLSCFFQLW